jgi:hypothetical protein
MFDFAMILLFFGAYVKILTVFFSGQKLMEFTILGSQWQLQHIDTILNDEKLNFDVTGCLNISSYCIFSSFG